MNGQVLARALHCERQGEIGSATLRRGDPRSFIAQQDSQQQKDESSPPSTSRCAISAHAAPSGGGSGGSFGSAEKMRSYGAALPEPAAVSSRSSVACSGSLSFQFPSCMADAGAALPRSSPSGGTGIPAASRRGTRHFPERRSLPRWAWWRTVSPAARPGPVKENAGPAARCLPAAERARRECDCGNSRRYCRVLRRAAHTSSKALRSSSVSR